MITLKDVKANEQILEFINQTDRAMDALSYTNHGLRHTGVVADRAMKIAKSMTTKLAWLLAQNMSYEQIKQKMLEDFHG